MNTKETQKEKRKINGREDKMAVLQTVKARVAGYDPYDAASQKKEKLDKILLVLKVVLMVGIFVAFAIYDSQNPVVTMTHTNELPFALPHIFIEYARVNTCRISTVDFDPDAGWNPNNNNAVNCNFFHEFTPFPPKVPVSKYAYYFVPRVGGPLFEVNQSRFQMRLRVTDCNWGGFGEIFYTVFDPDSLSLYADNLGSCGYQSYINVRKQIFFRSNGKKDIQYSLSLNGFAPQRIGGINASDALLNFMFDNSVQITTEETPFGLFKRIVTDAGGLLSVVVVIIALLEYVIIRSLFDEPQFYFPHDLRETVLWITDPEHKRTLNP